MVWYLFLRECWDCMQRVIGRVEATRSCCWRISFFSGILSDLGLTASWRCPAWFLLCLLSYHYPLFPPKKKSDAEKAELARAELDAFIASHGKVPSQHSDLPGSKSLYQKLQKLKTPASVENMIGAVVFCDDTLKFYDLHGRIPRRQNMTTDEQRAEDALAQTLGTVFRRRKRHFPMNC